MNAPCVFCSIISGHIPAAIVAENDHVVVIKDRAPKAPIHYLVIPKLHVTDLRYLPLGQEHIGAEIFGMLRDVATALVQPNDFRLVMNNGAAVGQSVFHAHMHFLAGTTYSDL